MGPIKVVNFGALGTPARTGDRSIPFLGQESPEISSAAAQLENAKEMVSRVSANYSNLVQLIGEEDAQNAYQQALDNLQKSQGNYDDLVERSR